MKTLKICALILLATAGALRADRPVDQRLPAAPDAQVTISNLAGSVRITGWSQGEVHVSGTVGDDTEGLTATGDRTRIEIKVEIPKGRFKGDRDLAADLVVRVPAGCRLEVRTVSATIAAAELSGALELNSVSGTVQVSGDPREVEVETVSGTIEIRGVGTGVHAESVSGRVRLEGVAGRVEATTVSGNLEVRAEEIERGEFQSVSGSVTFDGSLRPGSRLEVSNTSGNVELTLPSDLPAAYEITTFSGSIKNEFGPEPQRTSRYAPGKELKFTVGGGGAQVNVQSFSGSVRLKKK